MFNYLLLFGSLSAHYIRYCAVQYFSSINTFSAYHMPVLVRYSSEIVLHFALSGQLYLNFSFPLLFDLSERLLGA